MPVFMRPVLRRLVCSLVLIGLLFLLMPVSSRALSIEEEKKLGKDFFLYIKNHGYILEDLDISAYINELGQKVLKVTGPQPFNYRFFVIDDQTINAFAVPGGYVFLFTGLIRAYEHEGELAATIAHEIAHVTSRHIASQIEKTQKLSLATMGAVLAGVFIGGPIGSAVAFGSMAGAIQAQFKYSRDDEREADNKGLDYLVGAGYDPNFMIESFRIILKASQYMPEGPPTYLTTHPGLAERMSSVEAGVAAHPGYGRIKGQGDQKAFEAIRTKIIARYIDPVSAQNHFDRRLKENPDDPLARYGLAVLHQSQQKFDLAQEEYTLALNKDPDNPAFMTDLAGLLIQKGNYDQALFYLGRASMLNPSSPQISLLLAQVYQTQNRPDQAKTQLLKVLDFNPEHEESLYNLGLAYGRLGNLSRARYYTGLSFKVRGDPKTALYHLKIALEQATENDGFRERIQQEIKELEKQLADQTKRIGR